MTVNSSKFQAFGISNTVEAVNESLNTAQKYGYESSYYIIQHLLNECEKAQFEDQRTAITEQIFNYLIENPTIFKYDNEFRNSVIDKMNQLEARIRTRMENFNRAEYDEAIKIMKTSFRVIVTHSHMRAVLYNNMRNITHTLKMYEEWAKGDGLKKCFTRLRDLLKDN